MLTKPVHYTGFCLTDILLYIYTKKMNKAQFFLFTGLAIASIVPAFAQSGWKTRTDDYGKKHDVYEYHANHDKIEKKKEERIIPAHVNVPAAKTPEELKKEEEEKQAARERYKKEVEAAKAQYTSNVQLAKVIPYCKPSIAYGLAKNNLNVLVGYINNQEDKHRFWLNYYRGAFETLDDREVDVLISDSTNGNYMTGNLFTSGDMAKVTQDLIETGHRDIATKFLASSRGRRIEGALKSEYFHTPTDIYESTTPENEQNILNVANYYMAAGQPLLAYKALYANNIGNSAVNTATMDQVIAPNNSAEQRDAFISSHNLPIVEYKLFRFTQAERYIKEEIKVQAYHHIYHSEDVNFMHTYLIPILFHTRRYDSCIQHCNNLVWDSANQVAITWKVRSLSEKGQTVEALAALNKYLARYPDFTDGYALRYLISLKSANTKAPAKKGTVTSLPPDLLKATGKKETYWTKLAYGKWLLKNNMLLEAAQCFDYIIKTG